LHLKFRWVLISECGGEFNGSSYTNFIGCTVIQGYLKITITAFQAGHGYVAYNESSYLTYLIPVSNNSAFLGPLKPFL